jgi:hypothetical protein
LLFDELEALNVGLGDIESVVAGREFLLRLDEESRLEPIDAELLGNLMKSSSSKATDLLNEERRRMDGYAERRERILRAKIGEQLGTLLGVPCWIREGDGFEIIPPRPAGIWRGGKRVV